MDEDEDFESCSSSDEEVKEGGDSSQVKSIISNSIVLN
jgi:hypothetical protein